MTKDTITIPHILREVAKIFNAAGFQSFLVGGAVRDSVMGREPSDFDIATNATPNLVQQLFHHTIPTGIEHGTITIIYKGLHIESTTFRADQGYYDGRHPDKIIFANSIEDDLSRRDFTINAIAADLLSGKIVDPYGGRIDIQKKLIRTVGNPVERFSEDGLRPLRGIRFSAQLGFCIDPPTFAAIPEAIPVTCKVAIERVRDEFSKMLLSPHPSVALQLMEKTGLLKKYIPELTLCRGIEQRGMHAFDVLDHLYHSCDGTSRKSLIVRMAALLHDIGKPNVRAIGENNTYTFYHHEAVSAKIAREILTRFKFSALQIDDICALIAMHMFHYEPIWTDAAVRRFLAKATEYTRFGSGNTKSRLLSDFLDDLFELRHGDTFGISGKKQPDPLLEEFTERIAAVVSSQNALSLKDLAVNGSDLIATGIPAGKQLGFILSELLNTVLDSPAMNTKESLLTIARNLYTANNL